jgi:hypothetical protein
MRKLVPLYPSQSRHRRVLLPWRLAFVTFAIALATGTHWPSLEIGPEVPATDKTIHLLAFGSATVLLYLTRWIRSIWLTGVIVFLWAFVDELSQNIPGLGRTSTWHDMLANGMGIAVACAWLWALRPIGVRNGDGVGGEFVSGPNRMRLRALGFVFEEVFIDRRAWIAAIMGGCVGAMPILFGLFFMEAERARIAFSTGIVIGMVLTLLQWTLLWQATLDRSLRDKPCLHCGAPSKGDDLNACDACGARRSAGDWLPAQPPTRAVLLRSSMRAAFVGSVALIFGFAVILISPVVYAMILNQGTTSSGAQSTMRAVHSIGRLPQELVRTIDLALYLLLFAVVARIFRAQIARFYDQAVRCLRCGHDLRATPSTKGIGHCGECEAAFVRANDGNGTTDEHG